MSGKTALEEHQRELSSFDHHICVQKKSKFLVGIIIMNGTKNRHYMRFFHFWKMAKKDTAIIQSHQLAWGQVKQQTSRKLDFLGPLSYF